MINVFICLNQIFRQLFYKRVLVKVNKCQMKFMALYESKNRVCKDEPDKLEMDNYNESGAKCFRFRILFS